jgi:molybdopterin-guanine dinucleotide biosynthesis protein A
MGRNKALLPFRGRPLIARVYEAVHSRFEDIFLVTNNPGLFDAVPCPKITDRIPGKGPISGVDAALRHSRNPYVLVVGCDAPFLSLPLLERLAGETGEADLVIPFGPDGPEPLCAIYGKGCLPLIEEFLQAGDFSLMSLIGRVRTREVSREDVATVDPGFLSFRNINTPKDFRMLAGRDP